MPYSTDLGQSLRPDLVGASLRCRRFVILTDVWRTTEILSERGPSAALIASFRPPLTLLAFWRGDGNCQGAARWASQFIHAFRNARGFAFNPPRPPP